MSDWIADHFGWVLGAALLILGGLLWWGISDMNAWEARCDDASGVVESRYIGDTVIYVNNNGILSPIITPNYSYHCMVNGQEIAV